MSADDFTLNDPELLRQRWEISHSPQLALQLAEEYRRRDRREDAIGVLAKSLELNPGHLAARMAMGRYRLEIGQKHEACADLEAVVAADPTHLVANKLLVGLYMDLGRDQASRDRLDLYALLNEGDPEIEVLEERWRATHSSDDTPVFDLPDAGIEGAALEFGASEPVVDTATASDVPSAVPETKAAEDPTEPFNGLWLDIAHRTGHDPVGWEDVFEMSAIPSAGVVIAAGTQDPAHEVSEAPEDGATVTMAELYLSQGHLEDAENAFREVLASDPGNEAALRGLQQLLGEPEADLTAARLLANVDVGRRSVGGKKIELLKRYLERLRPTSQ